MKNINLLYLLKLGVHVHSAKPIEIFRLEKLPSYVSLGKIAVADLWIKMEWCTQYITLLKIHQC